MTDPGHPASPGGRIAQPPFSLPLIAILRGITPGEAAAHRWGKLN